MVYLEGPASLTFCPVFVLLSIWDLYKPDETFVWEDIGYLFGSLLWETTFSDVLFVLTVLKAVLFSVIPFGFKLFSVIFIFFWAATEKDSIIAVVKPRIIRIDVESLDI